MFSKKREENGFFFFLICLVDIEICLYVSTRMRLDRNEIWPHWTEVPYSPHPLHPFIGRLPNCLQIEISERGSIFIECLLILLVESEGQSIELDVIGWKAHLWKRPRRDSTVRAWFLRCRAGNGVLVKFGWLVLVGLRIHDVESESRERSIEFCKMLLFSLT